MARVFVAVRLPAFLAEKIASVQGALDRALADVKWVETENLHLTLRFFGELDPGAMARVAAAVTTVTAATTAFAVRIEGLGTFPERGRPRVIWAGIAQGGDELKQLAVGLEEEFVRVGLGRGDRPFAPHLTLGRVRDPNARRGSQTGPVPLQATAAMRAAIGATVFEPGVFEVSEVVVVESRLSPRGPHYQDLHRGILGAKHGEDAEPA